MHFCFRHNYCFCRYRPRYRRLFEKGTSRRPNLIQCGTRFPDEILLPQPSSSNKRLRKKRVSSESKESGDISTVNEIRPRKRTTFNYVSSNVIGRKKK